MSNEIRTIANLVANDDVLARLPAHDQIAGGIDAIRTELQETEAEILAGESMIQDVATTENVRTYGFVLEHPEYQAWRSTAGSAALGIVGAIASGKTIIAGLIYGDVGDRISATDATVLAIFAHRADLDHATRVDDKYWADRIRQAGDQVPALWNLFALLARQVGTIWLVLDSLHDCDEAVEGLLAQFVRASRRTSMTVKVVATSRTSDRFEKARINSLAYTAADLEAGTRAYTRARLEQMDVVRSGRLDGARLLPAVVAATSRMGGGHFWTRAVLGLLQHQRSTEGALRRLERLTDPVQLGDSLLSRLARSDDDDRHGFVLCVYGALLETPATASVADIRAVVAPTYPGTTLEEVQAVLDSRLQGIFAAVNGDYVRVTGQARAYQVETVRALLARIEAAEQDAREMAAATQFYEEAAAEMNQRVAEIKAAEDESGSNFRARLAAVKMAFCTG
ncbi:Cyanobacterial phytochrome B [Apiospora arundinis]